MARIFIRIVGRDVRNNGTTLPFILHALRIILHALRIEGRVVRINGTNILPRVQPSPLCVQPYEPRGGLYASTGQIFCQWDNPPLLAYNPPLDAKNFPQHSAFMQNKREGCSLRGEKLQIVEQWLQIVAANW
jgi:hypothetical protein